MPMKSISKFETFFLYFLNKDISFDIQRKKIKIEIHVFEGHSEGSISRILFLGLSFYFMFQKRTKKLPVF